MTLSKQADINGRDFYESLYASGIEQEAEWLRRGASQKVDSIETLLARNSIAPQKILELGCGPGAVIRECRHRALAHRYIGVDYSADAVNYLRNNAPGIEAIQADITSPDFSIEEEADVVVLSHVIEHLENPGEFLTATLQKLRFRYMIVEVPLEDLPGGRLKNLFWDRRINTTGHVQFFNPSSFMGLLTTHGLKIIDRYRYIPRNDFDTIRFLRAKDGLSLATVSRMAAGFVVASALHPIWSRLYHSHYAVLCSRFPEGV
jgi:SAM-dependent methyltransferase